MMNRKSALLRVSLIVCCVFTLLALVSASVGADEPTSCDSADKLVEWGFTEEAQERYVELLHSGAPDAFACASEALATIAAQAEAEDNDGDGSDELTLLASELTIVAERQWFGLGGPLRYASDGSLAIPIETNDANVLETLPPGTMIGILANSESGYSKPLEVKAIKTEEKLTQIELQADGLEGGNGTYAAKVDLIPSDEKKGNFTLTLKVRDIILLPILAVVLGVLLSELVRVTYSKYQPAKALDKRRKDLVDTIYGKGGGTTRETVEVKGTTAILPIDEGTWEKYLRVYDLTIPNEDVRRAWSDALNAYTIKPKSMERLNKIKDTLEKLYENRTIKAISADSTDEDVKGVYTSLTTEQTLVDALQSFTTEALYPAHFAYVAAESEHKETGIEVALLKSAKWKLYTAPSPVEVKNSDHLTQKASDLGSLVEVLHGMRQALYYYRLAVALAEELEVCAKDAFLFNVELDLEPGLVDPLSGDFRKEFEDHGISLSQKVVVTADQAGSIWWVRDKDKRRTYTVKKMDGVLKVYHADEAGDSTQKKFSDKDRISYYQVCGSLKKAVDTLGIATGATEIKAVAAQLEKDLGILRSLQAYYKPKVREGAPVGVVKAEAPIPSVKERAVEEPAKFAPPLWQVLSGFRFWPFTLSVVIALALGLHTLYFGDKTFGSLSDYVQALAWGLGVDVTTKSLAGILESLGVARK